MIHEINIFSNKKLAVSRSHGCLTQLWGKAWEFIKSKESRVGESLASPPVPRRGASSGPAVKGAPMLQGNGTTTSALAHLGSQDMLKTQRRT